MSGGRRWCLVLSCLLFAALAVPRLGQLAATDEILYAMRLGDQLYRQGFSHAETLPAFSPHLHGWCIGLAHCVFGAGDAVARLPGLIAWLAALILLWYRLRGTGGEWLVLLGATIPLAVQGAVIADIDQGLLVPLVFLQCWAVDAYVERRDRKSWLGVALAMLLALWGRLTTPTILIPLCVGYAWWRHSRRTALLTAAALVAGWMGFLATWGAYCGATGVPFAGPFRYLEESFLFATVGSRGASWRKVVFTGIYLWLWLGAGVAVLGGLAVWQRIRVWWRERRPERTDLFLAAGGFLLVGYAAVGGTLFGFPKYHCPAVPLLLVGCAPLVGDLRWDRRQILWLLGAIVFAGLGQFLLVGDPLLLVRRELRETIVAGDSIRPVLVTLALRLLIGLGLLAIPLAVLRRRAVLFGLAFGANLGLLLIQQGGGYQTGYVYGDRGDSVRVAAWLRERLPAEAVAIVPGEVVHLLDRPDLSYRENDQWKDVPELLAALGQPNVQAVGISPLTNDTEQVLTLTANPDIRRLLDASFAEHRLGAYVVFLRREGAE